MQKHTNLHISVWRPHKPNSIVSNYQDRAASRQHKPTYSEYNTATAITHPRRLEVSTSIMLTHTYKYWYRQFQYIPIIVP